MASPAGLVDNEDAPGSIRVRRIGPLGRLTLDRPAQINALTLDMITRMRSALLRWELDPGIDQVLIDGAGERGFCAGGDIRVVHDAALHRTNAAERLWRHEYLLDALINDYSKPVVVVLDGIAMGGGIGLGGHASHRIVTERSVLAMPEVMIGIAPDVGAALLFANAPNLLGRHLAMTGDRFGPGDALRLGIADVCVDSGDLPGLSDRLVVASADDVMKEYAQPAPPSPLADAEAWIATCYGANHAATILENLQEVGTPGATAAAARIRSASPLAVCVSLAAVARAATIKTLPEVLDQDLRVGLRLLEGSDPVEGIHSVIMDKTHQPRWHPASLSAVTHTQIERCFHDLGAAENQTRARIRDPSL
jgi:enoyl-CoA hydratase